MRLRVQLQAMEEAYHLPVRPVRWARFHRSSVLRRINLRRPIVIAGSGDTPTTLPLEKELM